VRGRLLGRGRFEPAATEHAEHRQRVDAEDPARDQRDGDGAQADAPPAADTKTATTPAAFAAAVLDVLALALAFPFHGAASR